VAARLVGGAPAMGAVAGELALSGRSLQRRLELEGTSYARIVDEARRSQAVALLSAPGVSVGEVTWLLGFSEQSAFSRAFRRWTGASPSEFRREARERA
jgi:AraC-like DNA-binding protein